MAKSKLAARDRNPPATEGAQCGDSLQGHGASWHMRRREAWRASKDSAAPTSHLCPFLSHCHSAGIHAPPLPRSSDFPFWKQAVQRSSSLALVLNWFSGDSVLAQHGPLLTSRPVNSDCKMLTWCLVTVAIVIGSRGGRFPQMALTSYWMALPSFHSLWDLNILQAAWEAMAKMGPWILLL